MLWNGIFFLLKYLIYPKTRFSSIVLLLVRQTFRIREKDIRIFRAFVKAENVGTLEYQKEGVQDVGANLLKDMEDMEPSWAVATTLNASIF